MYVYIYTENAKLEPCGLSGLTFPFQAARAHDINEPSSLDSEDLVVHNHVALAICRPLANHPGKVDFDPFSLTFNSPQALNLVSKIWQ